MSREILPLALSVILSVAAPKSARAYDIDCGIMLCMAGGFPPSAVCAAAYREMIRRITPWPVRPPFGLCTYAAVPAALGGPGGAEDLDISTPDYAWLRRTRVLWWTGRTWRPHDEDRQWSWTLRSCDGENRRCTIINDPYSSASPWPETLESENGQVIPSFGSGRAVMLEYSDYEGVMSHSDWFRY